jgi:WD40 repeat protein
MRTRLPLGACVAAILACSSNPNPSTPSPRVRAPSYEYAGVYVSTPDEDIFTPCGVELTGDTWSLKFRDNERRAPFLKQVTAVRGYAPLTHFIRVRGSLSPPGKYNLGFQARELAVDSVLEVNESLAPCAGFGVPAAWTGTPARFHNSRGYAFSGDRRLVAVMDLEGRITVWSTETGALVSKAGSIPKLDVSTSTYGPLALSGDGKLFAVGGSDAFVQVWRPLEGKKLFSLKLKDSTDAARETAMTAPRKDVVGVMPPRPNSYAPARELVFNKSGTMLATSSSLSTIIWSMETGKKLAEFNVGNDFRRKVFFVAEEGLLMAGDTGSMTLRASLDALPVTRPGTRAKWAEHATMSPDGRSLAVAGGSDSVYLWSIVEGPGRALRIPGFVTGVMTFSPDGNMIAIAGGASDLYLFDTRTGEPIRAFHNFPNALAGAWFSADGKSIITLSHFDDRFRIAYVDAGARAAAAARGKLYDDSLTAKLPLGPPPSNSPRTVAGVVTAATSQRAIPGADVSIMNGDGPDSVLAHATTSSGGYFSFPGIRFRHVVVRVQKPGFETGVKYIHLMRWSDNDRWSIELTPAASGGAAASPGG